MITFYSAGKDKRGKFKFPSTMRTPDFDRAVKMRRPESHHFLCNIAWSVIHGMALFATVCTAFAGPAAPECPASIREKSVQLVETPPGWRSFVGAPLYLHAAEPMISPPELLGSLIPDVERKGKTGMIYTYKIDGTFPDGKWLACRYGESDQVTLARALPAATTVCTFTYRKGEYGGQNMIKIDCR